MKTRPQPSPAPSVSRYPLTRTHTNTQTTTQTHTHKAHTHPQEGKENLKVKKDPQCSYLGRGVVGSEGRRGPITVQRCNGCVSVDKTVVLVQNPTLPVDSKGADPILHLLCALFPNRSLRRTATRCWGWMAVRWCSCPVATASATSASPSGCDATDGTHPSSSASERDPQRVRME